MYDQNGAVVTSIEPYSITDNLLEVLTNDASYTGVYYLTAKVYLVNYPNVISEAMAFTV